MVILEFLAIHWEKTLIPILILLGALTEFFYCRTVKKEKIDRPLGEWVFKKKIQSFLCSILVLWLAFFLLVLIETVYENFAIILKAIGIVGAIFIYFWINKLIAQKHGVLAKHQNNFKKGDVLKVKEGYEGTWGQGVNLSEKYKYEFRKNEKFNRVSVKSLDNHSCWQGELRVFSEDCFKKISKKRK